MKIDILNSLTKEDCATAITLATTLYDSKYSDNEIRMLYASAHGCNVGLKLYDAIGDLANFNIANPISQFPKMFPSTVADSRLASANYAQDALQAILNSGTVLAVPDQIYPGTYNVGSDNYVFRSDDANTYLMFISMAEIGTALNRFGSPSATYGQGTTLQWETMAAVKADTTGAACALASAFLNFFDGANSAFSYLAPSATGSIKAVLTIMQDPLVTQDPIPGRTTFGGNAHCLSDGYTQAQCTAAGQRLRFRGACSEQDPAASFAAGIIGAVNDLWL